MARTDSAARGGGARTRVPKRSEQMALTLIRRVVEQGLREGDKLPHEADLLEEYGVSRSSLREALRLLEVQGMIRIRPGPGAGTEVGRVTAGNLAPTLALYLLMNRITLNQLLDAWSLVEPVLARQAAQNPDRHRVTNVMAEFVSHDCTCGRPMQEGLTFHDAVADLSGNPVLALVLGAVGELVTTQVMAALPNPEAAMSDETEAAHLRIAEAILAGDGPRAEAEMHQHMVEVSAEIRSWIPGANDPIDVRS